MLVSARSTKVQCHILHSTETGDLHTSPMEFLPKLIENGNSSIACETRWLTWLNRDICFNIYIYISLTKSNFNYQPRYSLNVYLDFFL